MINDIAATLALDALPIGSQVAAAFIDHDETATVILFEHRMHEGERRWWDMTRNHVWWTAREIVQAHDDMTVTANPDQEQQEWAVAVEHPDGARRYIQYSDEASCARFINNPPMWFSLPDGESTLEIVRRVAASPWTRPNQADGSSS